MAGPRPNLDMATALKEATAQRDRAIQRVMDKSKSDEAIEEQTARLTAAVTNIIESIQNYERRLVTPNETITKELARLDNVLASFCSRREISEELDCEPEREQPEEPEEPEEPPNRLEDLLWAKTNESRAKLFHSHSFPELQQGRLIVIVREDRVHLECIFGGKAIPWSCDIANFALLPVPGAQLAVLLECEKIFVLEEHCYSDIVDWAQEMGVWTLQMPPVVRQAITNDISF